ncbi:putative TRI15 [Colletotrichum sublineola]|uniref:Putative TRI15 n=1 Tax=Colletotrichum sublineola TaxID=1173701 RepID=A0A066X2S7_COLSU|nr:putative TRI15 [Colletotrichum sublineola]
MASEDKETSAETSSLNKGLSRLRIEDLCADDLGSSDGSEDSADAFDTTRCLFCNGHSKDLDDNLDHMRKRHGMAIPYPESLIVDLETLLKYLHLVIYEYTECLYCGSIRNTPQAAQQHMTGKGHCRIDIDKGTSEFKDFYDLESKPDSDGDHFCGPRRDYFVDVEDETRRLPSGKTVTHRNAKKVRYQQDSKAREETNSLSRLEEGECSQDLTDSALMTKNGKNEDLVMSEKSNNMFNKQLTSMRQEDQLALAHLPLPQQRALISKVKKQQEKWNRFENDQAIKLQCKYMGK